MLSKNIISLIILAACAVTVAGQEKPKLTVNSNGEIAAPPQWEEYARRRSELLKNPDFLDLKLEPIFPKHGEEGEGAKSFRAGKKISFQLLMINTLSEPFAIDTGCYYDNTRPVLMKEGAVLPYHKRATKSVENKSGLLTRTNGLSIILRPNKTQPVGTVDLKDWYEAFEPGRYLLTVQYRPGGSEKWLESSPIMFEVSPNFSH
ncbi:MAG TPA: hypothetical protein VF791_20115 [Pyrinomonadaceae bacterium]